MRRALLVCALCGVIALPLSSGCEKEPPQPKIEWSPASGTVTAGDRIEVRATKPMVHRDVAFTYAWSLEGDCAGKLEKTDDWKLEYVVPKDCAGGKIVAKLACSSQLGKTDHTVSFSIEAQKVEKVGLEPVRPAPLPKSWDMLNDFDGTLGEKPEEHKNKRGAFVGTWPYRDGKCVVAAAKDGEHGVMELGFTLPHSDLSACGYFEYFDGARGDAKSADLSGYEAIGFMLKSKTGDKVRIRPELVEFDKYANYNQGIVEEIKPIVVDGEWRRYEIPLRKLATTWDVKTTKSFGFRINSKDGNPGQGAVLIDNLVLVKSAK